MPNRNLNKQNKGSNLHLYPTGNQSSEITNFQVILESVNLYGYFVVLIFRRISRRGKFVHKLNRSKTVGKLCRKMPKT